MTDRLLAAIVIASDSRSQGRAADTTIAPLTRTLEAAGLRVARTEIVADEVTVLGDCIARCADEPGVCLVVTSGGTGIGPRDVTPDATSAVVERQIPGIAEMLRARSAAATPHAWLSRGVAGIRSGAIVVNVPGSPKGAVECVDMVLELLPHALDVLSGSSHDDHATIAVRT